ncbi:MAG: zinc ribbon domain-containing protein [Clostridia bacterium]|nr:zinc ribbon domain-containing protein [Clostridia bacterium]
MYCKQCGALIPDGTKVCPACGAAQNTVSEKRKKTSRILCMLSLIIGIAIPAMLGLISLLLVYVFRFSGNQFWISEIAYFLPQPGLAMMIAARILDRESRFAKVLMWLYIVLLGLIGLILLAAVILGIALFASCAGSGGYWM